MSFPTRPDDRESRRILLLASLGWVLLPWLQWMPVDFERGALLIAFGPALWAGKQLALREWARWWASPVLRALLLTGLASLGVSTLIAVQPAPGVTQAAQILVLGWIALLVGGLRSEVPGATRSLIGGFVLGALSGVLALLISWMLHSSPHHTRPDLLLSFYPHPRHIGLHLLPAAAIVPMLAALATSRATRLGLLTVSAVLMGALIWSGGRMPVVALTAAALACCWFGRRQVPCWRILLAYALPVLAGLTLSTFFWTEAGHFGWWRSVATVANANDLNELSSLRIDIWRACLDFIPEHPWFGWGPDAYRFLLPKMDGQQPHNIVVQALLCYGLAGLFWGGCAIYWLLPLRPHASPRLAEELPVLAVLIVVLAGGLFDGTLYHVLSTSGLALAVGLLIANKARGSPCESPGRSKVLPIALAIGTLLVFTLHFFVFYRLSPVREAPAPTSLTAQAVRSFPSTTIGLDLWLSQWAESAPDTALDWAFWAQSHSTYGWSYHALAAKLLAAQGRLEEARYEIQRYHATQPQAFRQQLRTGKPEEPQPGFAPDANASHH